MIDRLRVDLPTVSGLSEITSALKRPQTADIFRKELRLPDLGAIRNPIHDTNERLSDVVKKLDSMEGLAL